MNEITTAVVIETKQYKKPGDLFENVADFVKVQAGTLTGFQLHYTDDAEYFALLIFEGATP